VQRKKPAPAIAKQRARSRNYPVLVKIREGEKTPQNVETHACGDIGDLVEESIVSVMSRERRGSR
jgi:hypothetical protein